MHLQKRQLLWINLLGGVAVLGSYAYGFRVLGESAGEFWGGVPEALRGYYTVSMCLAAVGYFPLASFLFLRVDPAKARIGGRFSFGLFNLLYGIILAASALWMPMTSEMITSGAPLWTAIVIDLALVGLASLGLLAAIASLQPRQPRFEYLLAVVGAILFCHQTALLDAIVWPAYFPR